MNDYDRLGVNTFLFAYYRKYTCGYVQGGNEIITLKP